MNQHISKDKRVNVHVLDKKGINRKPNMWFLAAILIRGRIYYRRYYYLSMRFPDIGMAKWQMVSSCAAFEILLNVPSFTCRGYFATRTVNSSNSVNTDKIHSDITCILKCIVFYTRSHARTHIHTHTHN